MDQHYIKTPIADEVSPNLTLTEKIREIIRLACYSPSGDNCQPWRYELKENTLNVYYLKNLGDHSLNNNNHATYLALGTLIEIVNISSSEYGLNVKINLIDAKSDPDPMVQFCFSIGAIKSDPLFSMITKRCTDRREYLLQNLDPLLIQNLYQIAENYPKCKFSILEGLSTDLENYLVKSDEFMWKHTQVLVDLFKWTRLSNKEFNETEDGMHWKNMGIKWYELPMIHLLRKWPNLSNKLWKLGFSKTINKKTLKSIKSNSAFLGFFIQTDTKQHLIESGQLAMRLWLFMTAKGYSLQPLSLASLTAFDFATGALPNKNYNEIPLSNLDANIFKTHFLKGIELLKKEFKVEGHYLPVWLFRAGIPAERGEVFRTKKRFINIDNSSI